MTFMHQNKKMVIKGDPSFTMARMSLKSIVKTREDLDQGYLVECRALEGSEWLSDQAGIGVLTMEETVAVTLISFEDVFEWPEKLPP